MSQSHSPVYAPFFNVGGSLTHTPGAACASSIGIGIDPIFLIHVSASTGAPFIFLTQNDANASNLSFLPFSLANGGRITANWGTGVGYLGLGAAVDDQVVITNNGAVGINTLNPQATLHINGNVRVDKRLLAAKGADVVSANDLLLGDDGNTFIVTGATQVNTIYADNWTAGSQITLIFSGAPRVKHNGSGSGVPVLLSGSADLDVIAPTVLGLVYDGTQWRQTFITAA